MASLTGNLVAETYKALLKTIDNDILTASEKQITDGLGGGSNVFIDSQGFLRANKYKVTNGLATQFLKADGSLDSNAYLTSITGAQVITALGYTPVTNQRTLTINGVGYNLSADRSWTVEGTAAVWGNITGTLSNQTDLQNALNAKYNNPTGTISQYIRGDGSIANFPAVTGFVPYTGATANVDLGEYALSAEYLAIDTDTTHVTDVGEIVWNPIDGTFDMGLLNGVVLQAGQELHFYGKASGAIGNGQAVMFAGVEGDHLLMSLADAATINANPQYFIGIATQDFANNDFGYVTVLGKVRGLNTTSYSLGDVLYYNSTSATDGSLTTTMPVAPNAKIEVAAVVRVHATQGILMVRPHIMPKLNQVQDVYIADPANNHGLFYDLANGYWKNTSIASALGYTPQAQLSGTGFVKASGTTISYDNSTYLTTADAASTYQRLDRMAINLLASDIQYPNNNAVIAALALKANAANPVFTGNMTISGAEPKLFFTDTDNNPDYTVFIDSGVFYIYDQTAGTTRFSISSTGNISAGVGKSITADSFIKDGGTASQFLKADGSIDSNTYVASSALANYLLISTAASTYQRLDKMVSNLLPSSTEYPNSQAVINALALKADAANPVFTGNMSISGAEPKLYFVDTDQNPDYTVFVDSGFFYIYDQTAGATRFSINSSGNISTGVGKSITAGSFVKDGGTASQFLMADGSVSTGIANTITGSLTSGYIPKATGANTLGNSLIYENASKVFIGTTTTNSISTGGLTLSNGTSSSLVLFNAGVIGFIYGSTVAAGMAISSDKDMRFETGDGSGSNWPERMRLFQLTGNLRIGYGSAPADAGFKLDVNGTGRFSGAVTGTRFEANASNGIFGINTNGNDDINYRFFQFSTSGTTYVINTQMGAAGEYDIWSFAGGWERNLRITTSGNANFRGNVNANGNASTTPSFIANNPSGASGTAQHYINFTAGATVLGRILRGNGASGLEANGLNIDNFAGFKVRLNQLGGSGGIFSVDGGAATFSGSITAGNELISRTANYPQIVFQETTTTTDALIFYDNVASPKQMGFRVNSGSNVMSLTSSNVLIGTTLDNGARLRVVGGTIDFAGDTRYGVARVYNASVGDMFGMEQVGSTQTGSGAATRLFVAPGGTNYLSLGWYTNATAFVDALKIAGSGGAATFISSVTATSFFESSDFRLKTLIEHNPIVAGIENLQAKLYEKNGKIEIGYFAQDAELIMPYAVTKNDDGFLNLSYREVHTAKIARLEQRVAELEKQLNVA